MECVLLLAGMDDDRDDPWRRFAAELGVLFQIVDDILDVTGTDADARQAAGQRRAAGKRTYVSEFGLEARATWRAIPRGRARPLAEAAPAGAPELEQITDFIFTRTAYPVAP